MKGLIIKSPWIDMVLDGYKDIELRGNNTTIRGTVGLIKSGSKMVYGTVDLVDCLPIETEELYSQYRNRHRVPYDFKDIKYKNLYGWVFENPKRYTEPKPYNHKQGCVIWVNID